MTIFYFVIHLFISLVLPWPTAAKLAMPTADVLKATLGYDWAFSLVLIAGLLGIITTLNACVICALRLFYSAADAGFLPAWFGVIDKNSGNLRNAVCFVGILIVIGPFLALSWLATDLGPISFICAFIVTCFAALKLRQPDSDKRDRRIIKNKLTIYVGIAVSLTLAASMFIPGFYYHIRWPDGYVFLLLWAVAGFIFYRLSAYQNSTQETKEHN